MQKALCRIDGGIETPEGGKIIKEKIAVERKPSRKFTKIPIPLYANI